MTTFKNPSKIDQWAVQTVTQAEEDSPTLIHKDSVPEEARRDVEGRN